MPQAKKRSTTGRRNPIKSGCGSLSFVSKRARAHAVVGKSTRKFWSVKKSGDYAADCIRGESLALEYLDYVSSIDRDLHPEFLQFIVRDMPRTMDGLVVGFFSIIGVAAGAGHLEGRAQADRWVESRKSRQP